MLAVPLVGRDADIAELLGAIGRSRLITLVGPGGSGKTRLAYAVRDRLSAAGRPTWWVSLAQLDRPSLLDAAVAGALGAAETPGRAPREVLAELLRDTEGLLVLDNCEHLVAGCAALVGYLLRECPGLRVLTTSREPLAVALETAWWVGGLSVPADAPAPTAADLAGSQAVRMFTDRARLVVADFAVTDANAADVARLCRRLDGLPLALELAAARLRMLPLPRIVDYLDDAVSLLATTDRDVPARQATLRATLDWSHDLLSGPERAMFARLSVFRGGFTLAAASAVAAGGDADLDTLRLLARLVDKSLVQARTDGAEERYRLLEVVRQYAAQRLGDQAHHISARHAAFMLTVTERAEEGLDGGDQSRWLGRLDHDRHNLRAALSWADSHEPVLFIRLAGALGRYWRLTGQYAEGRQWLGRAVLAAHHGISSTARAKALTALGTMEFLQCDYPSAAARLNRARDLYAVTGDDRGRAVTLQFLGCIDREQGRYAEARRHHEEVLEIRRRGGEPAGIARALRSMGLTAWLENDHARAERLSGEALRRFRELGDDEGVATTLVHLACARHGGGDPDGARPLLQAALDLGRRLGLREVTAWAEERLGLIAADAGDRDEAVALLRRSLTVHHELGDRWRTAAVLDALGGLCADARLLAAAARLRETLGTPVPPADRAAHDRRVHATAEVAGEVLPLDHAVRAALAPPAEVVVRALGRSAVVLSGRALGPEDWTYAKPRELLYHLLTRPGATKAEIGLALWPDASRTELRNSFHTCLKFLRRAVGDAMTVRYSGGAYHVESALPLRYDVAGFRGAAATARDVGALQEAAGYYHGDFLADLPAGEWAEEQREDLRREYERVLRTLGGLLARDGRFAEAAGVFTRLIAHDPLIEAGHRGLMRCHAALGERGRALHQYQQLTRLLDDRLGTAPAPETARLHARLRAG